MKTSELKDHALDWAVALANGQKEFWTTDNYSTNWALGGPIIEREGINIERVNNHGRWEAWTPAPERRSGEAVEQGTTPLIAAMRCFVASKLGDEIEVPNELTGE